MSETYNSWTTNMGRRSYTVSNYEKYTAPATWVDAYDKKGYGYEFDRTIAPYRHRPRTPQVVPSTPSVPASAPKVEPKVEPKPKAPPATPVGAQRVPMDDF